MKNRMKKGFLSYFTIQLKRYLKGLPLIMSITVLILVAISLIAYSYMKNRSESAEQNLAVIGVVGDLEGSYLGVGIAAIESLDASQYTIDFEEMSKEEAEDKLSSGEIQVYIEIPENFVDEIVAGERPKLKMVGRGNQGIGGLIITELADVIMVYLNSSETAMYAMQSYAWSKGNQNAFGTVADEFFMYEVELLFERDSVLEPEIVGVGSGSSVVGYYACGVVILFVLLMGIGFCSIFVRQKKDIQKVLSAQGVYHWKQVLAEYFCYLMVMLAIITMLVGIAAIVVSAKDIKLSLWTRLPKGIRWYSTARILWTVYAKWIPVVAMIASLQYMIFELTDGIVSAVLAQFLTAIGFGYVCGLFYPITFFPTAVQKAAAFLPVKLAMDYCQNTLRWQQDVLHLLAVMLYLVVFVIIAVWVRRYKLRR